VDTGKYFDDLTLPDGLLPALSDAYMYCSYLTRPDKHRLKDTYVRLIRNMVGKLIALPSKSEIEKRRHRTVSAHVKPTILVPLEWFNSLHAMYRCYADAVGQLRPHFRLVASCKKEMLDEKARELFDDFLWLPDPNVAIDKVIEQVAELAPDIIFYPSVGMALWWVACAQLRLAPIQVMGLGHPASSHSPEMDYVLADKGMIENTAHFTERVLELPPNAFRFLERADTVVPPPHVRSADDPIRIAVPSMVVKVTVPYLQMCKRIVERAGRKVEFHFFPNVLGLWRFQAKRQLDRWFPTGAVIHHRYGYAQFLAVLNSCDLMLSTFPFGGTNSLVDAMMCGVPIVCLEMPDGHVHERCDSWALRRVGLDDLIAQSIAEYEDTAVHMIQDDASRRLHADHLRGTDVQKIFFGPLTGDADGAVLRAFQYVYAHHEEIQATDWRVIPWEKQL
jgi:glycosyltransferase involved in cell wall biosynthesis